MEALLQIFLTIISVVVTGIVGYYVHKIKRRDEQREAYEQQRAVDILTREKATNEALRALCRDRILQGYRYYTAHHGVSAQDLESMTKLYNAYHTLGGNSIITTIYDKILDMPIKESE